MQAWPRSGGRQVASTSRLRRRRLPLATASAIAVRLPSCTSRRASRLATQARQRPRSTRPSPTTARWSARWSPRRPFTPPWSLHGQAHRLHPARRQSAGRSRRRSRPPTARRAGTTCVGGGYVCGKYVTLDLNNPQVRLGTTAPNLDDVLPYQYAWNTTMGTPLYKSVPSREDMLHVRAVSARPSARRRPSATGEAPTTRAPESRQSLRPAADALMRGRRRRRAATKKPPGGRATSTAASPTSS